jgi:hypothetical protein
LKKFNLSNSEKEGLTMHKNKMYACFAFFPDGSVKRWKYVTDLSSFSQFLAKSHPLWKYFNVYDKGTKSYLKRFYPGNPVPKILAVLLMALLAPKFTFSKRASVPYENTFNKTTFIKTTFNNGFNNSATIPMLLKGKGEGLC